MSELIPTFYLHAETPAGERWFYPRPVLTDRDRMGFDSRDLRWRGIVDNPQAGDGIPDAYIVDMAVLSHPDTNAWDKPYGEFLVSDQPVDAIGAVWSGRSRVVGHQLQPNPGGDQAALWEYAKAHFGERVEAYPADRDDPTWSSVRGLYESVTETEPDQTREFDVRGYVAIDGDPDPDPTRTWMLDEPALGNFYGRVAAHLFPGSLYGLRNAVAAHVEHAVKELGLNLSVYLFESKRELVVHGPIPYDEVLPYRSATGRSKSARDAEHQRQRKATFGAHFKHEAQLVDRLSAPTKREALEAWDAKVAELAAPFIPPHTAVCSHCKGYGYTS